MCLGCNPIALGWLKAPVEYGADIAVGEGQPLGIAKHWRPISRFYGYDGETDAEAAGKNCWRDHGCSGEKSFCADTSGPGTAYKKRKGQQQCTLDQALCALHAAVYLSVMGARGIELAARHCAANAHYLCGRLEGLRIQKKISRNLFFMNLSQYHLWRQGQ